MVRVLFEYDEDSRKWEVYVNGTETPLEARQAFSAVVVTCQELPYNLLEMTKVEDTPRQEQAETGMYPYKIIPCVGVTR